MIVYNITVKVNHEIEEEWLQWQKQEHIPEILATQQFIEHKFFRLLNVDESDGITYAIQFLAEDMQHYKTYATQYAAALNAKANAKWGDKFVLFATILQSVH